MIVADTDSGGVGKRGKKDARSDRRTASLLWTK